MKKTAAILLMTILTAMTFSCSSDSNNNNNNSDDTYMHFKVNGTSKEFSTPETLTSLSTLIMGYEGTGDTYQAVSLWIPNNATVGTHPIEPNNGSQTDIYSASYNQTFDLQADATSGTLTISSITADYITGTFSFVGVDSNNTTYTITEGTFRADNTTIPAN